MIIDQKVLDELTAQAKASARLRQHLDLRNSSAKMSQRMLNALETGTVMRKHRHCAGWEAVLIPLALVNGMPQSAQ